MSPIKMKIHGCHVELIVITLKLDFEPSLNYSPTLKKGEGRQYSI